MLKKANKRLFMLRSLKRFGFDQDELTVVYKSYVRPVIEYADVVWHSGLTHKQAGDVERIQRRACRTILGRQFTTYTESIKQCNLDRLSERRVDHCLKFDKGLVDNRRTSHFVTTHQNFHPWQKSEICQQILPTQDQDQQIQEEPHPLFCFSAEQVIIHYLFPFFPGFPVHRGGRIAGGGGVGFCVILIGWLMGDLNEVKCANFWNLFVPHFVHIGESGANWHPFF